MALGIVQEGQADNHFRYSIRKLFTGFILAARIDWKLTVAIVIANAPIAAATKNHALTSMRYS